MKNRNITDKEIKAIIRKKEIELLMAVESNHNQMKTIGKNAILGNIYSIENEIRQINKINEIIFNNVLNDILRLDNLAIATLGSFDINKLLEPFGK